MDYMIMLQ